MLRFSCLIAVAFGAASLANSAVLGTYEGNVLVTDTVLFKGVSLDDVRSVSGYFTSKSMGTGGHKITASAYYYERDDETLTVQFQVYCGDYTKGAKIQLVQKDGDIVGKSILTGYVNDKYRNYEGTDMDGGLWTTSTGASYIICNISISDEDDSALRTKLAWNGGNGGSWDSDTANWLTDNGVATVWIPGAQAVFTNDAVQSVVVSDDGVNASRFVMKGMPVTFSGGTITMTGASEVVMETGRVRFECPLAGSNGFRVANGRSVSDFSASAPVALDWNMLIANANLSSCAGFTGKPSGKIKGADSTKQYSYFLESNGSVSTTQMQWYGGGYTKCVVVELKQQGADIYGRMVSCAYIDDKDVDWRGADFRTHPDVVEMTLVDSSGEYNYAVANLIMAPRVELASDNTFTGLVRIDYGSVLAIDGGTLGEGVYSDPIINYSSMLEISHTRQSLAAISDSAFSDTPGRVVIKGSIDTHSGKPTISFPYNLPTTKEVIFQNAKLSAWTGVAAQMCPTSMSDKKFPWATAFYFRNNGRTARCQFHIKDDKYAKCVLYEFTQEGDDITCERIGGTYKEGKDVYFGNNFSDASFTGSSYACSNLVVMVTNATDTAVTFTRSNSYYDGTLVDGALLAITQSSALPSTSGRVASLMGGAKLFVDVDAPSVATGSIGSSTVNVLEGSYLCFARFRSNGPSAYVNASGGSEIALCGGNGNNKLDFPYLAHLSIKDGAVVTGNPIRVGYERINSEDNVTEIPCSGIKVDGDKMVYVNVPIYIVRRSFSSNQMEYDYNWELDVADVTGDAEPDLVFCDSVNDYTADGGLSGRPIRKIGDGTVFFGGVNNYAGCITIAEGTIQLGADGALNADVNLVLEGGTLDASENTNAAGTLSLTSDGTVFVSAESSLSFADSSAVDWGDNMLEVTGTAGESSLRFGTDKNGLTSSQLFRIRWNGSRVAIDENGYVAPCTYGTCFIVR